MDNLLICSFYGEKIFYDKKRSINSVIKMIFELVLREQKEYKKRERIIGYIGLTQRYFEDDFKAHFRMNRTTMESLINLAEIRLTKKMMGRPQENVQLQCLVAVWVLANQESYR